LNKTDGTAFTVATKRMLRSWNELQADWINAATGTPWQTAGARGANDVAATADGSGSIGDANGWYDINVTASVQAFAGGAPNFGWRFEQTAGANTNKTFVARDSPTTASRPKLTITYGPGGTGGGTGPYELWVTVNPLDKLVIKQGETFDIIVDTPTRPLQSVEFYIDNVLKATDTTAPFQFSWVTTASDAAGNHVLRVRATDTGGIVATETRTLTLLAGNCGAFAVPSSVAQGTPLSVQGLCSAYKTIDRMEFSLDGALQSVDPTSPYTWTLDTSSLALGAHTLAIDGKQGATVQGSASAAVTVTAPDVAISFSPGSVISKGETVTVGAAAGDGRALSQVDFYINGQIRAGAVAAPYESAWQGNDPWGGPEPFGRQTLLVQATDTAGNVLSGTRELYLLTQTCNVLLGSGKYRVGRNDEIYLAPNTFRQGQRIPIQGLCSSSASVQQMEFYLDNTLQTTDTTGPYNWLLDTTGLTLGAHTVAIKGKLGGTLESNHSLTIEVVAP
jgi:hypothetical protein